MFARAKPGPALYGSVRVVPRGTGLRRIIIPFQVKPGLISLCGSREVSLAAPRARLPDSLRSARLVARRDRVSSLPHPLRAIQRPRSGGVSWGSRFLDGSRRRLICSRINGKCGMREKYTRAYSIIWKRVEFFYNELFRTERETFLDARRSVRRDWRLTRGDKLETRCPKGRFVGALHMASVGGTLNDS